MPSTGTVCLGIHFPIRLALGLLRSPQAVSPHKEAVLIRRIRSKGFTLIELMIVVAIIGILAAIAIPNFIKFQARSKQGEAKANLKALFTAQRAYFQEKDRYSPYINEIGFTPERGNRYQYINGATVTYQARTAAGGVIACEGAASAGSASDRNTSLMSK